MSFLIQIECLDGGAGGDSGLADAIVSGGGLFAVVRACERYFIVVANVDCGVSAQPQTSYGERLTAEASWFDTAMTPDQEGAEDWLGQNVQDTVEHSFGVR